jgi:hypothetical protein
LHSTLCKARLVPRANHAFPASEEIALLPVTRHVPAD